MKDTGKCVSICCVVRIVDAHSTHCRRLSLSGGLLHDLVLEELLIEEAYFVVE